MTYYRRVVLMVYDTHVVELPDWAPNNFNYGDPRIQVKWVPVK